MYLKRYLKDIGEFEIERLLPSASASNMMQPTITRRKKLLILGQVLKLM